jgi:hypothetical protein
VNFGGRLRCSHGSGRRWRRSGSLRGRGLPFFLYWCGPGRRRRAFASHMLADGQREIVFKRARMCLLIVYAQLGEQVDNHGGLDFKLPCQLVDSDLTHNGNRLWA